MVAFTVEFFPIEARKVDNPFFSKVWVVLVDSLLKTTSLVDGVELASVDGKLDFGLALQAPRRIATGIRSKFFSFCSPIFC